MGALRGAPDFSWLLGSVQGFVGLLVQGLTLRHVPRLRVVRGSAEDNNCTHSPISGPDKSEFPKCDTVMIHLNKFPGFEHSSDLSCRTSV